MKIENDFKDLIEGYKISTHLLKISQPKLYEKLMQTIATLENDGAKFSLLVRNLKVDFMNENQQGDVASNTILKLNDNEKCFVFYSPNDNWSLNVIFQTKKLIGEKNILLCIYPLSLKFLKTYNSGLSYEVSQVAREKLPKNFYQYIAGYSNNELMLFKRKLNESDKVLQTYETSMEEVFGNAELDIF